jgi:hypothetical protein
VNRRGQATANILYTVGGEGEIGWQIGASATLLVVEGGGIVALLGGKRGHIVLTPLLCQILFS